MKKQDLLEIKMMFLEALNEFANGGISTMSAEGSGDDETTDDNELGTSGDNEEDDPETDKGGNGNTAANSGGTPAKDGRPKPDAGVGVF